MPKFVVPTTATVERTYEVEAENPEQAHARMRMWLDDHDALRDGVVVEKTSRNKTEPKVNVQEIKPVTLQAVAGAKKGDAA